MGQYTQVDPIGLAGGNPTLYGYVFNPLIDIDPFGLIDFRGLSDSELIKKLWELAYRDKKLHGNSGTHGLVHRIKEQITGSPQGWKNHNNQIENQLKNLRRGLDEARKRGLSEKVSNKYPGINRVAAMDPPPDPTAKKRVLKCPMKP